MANWLISQEVDLKTGAMQARVWPNTIMELGDKNSHTWEVSVKNGGIDVSLVGGTVVAYFIRKDGATVPVNGTASGNTASVTMPESCFTVAGELKAVMKVTLGTMIITIGTARFNVSGDITSTIVDPGTVVANLSELLTASETCAAAAEAALEAAADAESSNTLTDMKLKNIGVEVITGWADGYINLGNSTVPSTPSSSENFKYVIVECDPGDVFYVTGEGGSSSRIWGFLSALGTDDNRISAASGNTVCAQDKVVAPEGAAYAVFNVKTATPYCVTRGESIPDALSVGQEGVERVSGLPAGALDAEMGYILYGDTAFRRYNSGPGDTSFDVIQLGPVIRLNGVFATATTATRLTITSDLRSVGSNTVTAGIKLTDGHTYRFRQRVLSPSGSYGTIPKPIITLPSDYSIIGTSSATKQDQETGDWYRDFEYTDASYDSAGGVRLCIMIPRDGGNSFTDFVAEYTLEDLTAGGSLARRVDVIEGKLAYLEMSEQIDLSGMEEEE